MATIKKFNAIDRIGEIAQGFQQGVNNYSQGMQQQRAIELQDEALRRQQALDAQNAVTNELQIESKMSELTGKNLLGSGVGKAYMSGDQGSIAKLFETASMTPKFEAEKANRELDAEYKRSQINKNNRTTTQPQKLSEEQKIDLRFEKERENKLKEASIPDFDLADTSIVPTTKDAEEVKKMNASNKSFQEIGQRAAVMLEKANPKDPRYYLSNDWKMLNQDLTKLKLQAKNLEDLGVLNGPDLGLVNETLGSISPTSLALLGPKAAADRVKMALDSANKVMLNAASARNYKPKSSGNSSSIIEKVKTYSPEQLIAREQELLRKAGG